MYREAVVTEPGVGQQQVRRLGVQSAVHLSDEGCIAAVGHHRLLVEQRHHPPHQQIHAIGVGRVFHGPYAKAFGTIQGGLGHQHLLQQRIIESRTRKRRNEVLVGFGTNIKL